MFLFVEKDAILSKDIVIDRVNAVVSLDFMVNYVKVAFPYLDVNMAVVMFPLNVSVTKVGMDCSVQNPFVGLIVIKQEGIVRHQVNVAVD